jgi:hypothetical protein
MVRPKNAAVAAASPVLQEIRQELAAVTPESTA